MHIKQKHITRKRISFECKDFTLTSFVDTDAVHGEILQSLVEAFSILLFEQFPESTDEDDNGS